MLLVVRQAIFYALILAVAGPPLVLLSVFAAASALSFGLRILALLFGLSLTVVGIRKLQNRPVMMELTERGIMIHANADGVCISKSLQRDLFIPWQRIEFMSYLTRKEVREQGLRMVSGAWGAADPAIVIRIRTDEIWPQHGTLRDNFVTRSSRPNEIYLDVVECSPSETRLWAQAQAIARRYGVSTPERF
ncbi:MAG TPA: hypothetical protein VKY85_08545 [Candidatus Angelobacter sp.]|nr:hypothetical protein [Candidatus Angelobacter sp.]